MGKIKAKKETDVKTKKKVKPKKYKEVKILSDTQMEIRRLIIIAIITVILVIGVYFLSVLVVDKRNTNTTEEETTAEISYSKITVGMILNRPYDNYYVIVYDSNSNFATYYDSVASSYSYSDNAKKIYTIDLGNELNKNYVSESGTTNTKAKKITDLEFGEVSLVEVKNGSITSITDGIDNIKTKLD